MEPRIELLEPKMLVGMRVQMSLAADKTVQLWRGFMPRRHEIQGKLTTNVVNMQVYERPPFPLFSPDTLFEKWAAVEVTDHSEVPAQMEPYTLTGGTYAVFVHNGPASSFPKTLQYIYGTWLPASGYELDHREHFEVLGEGYRPDDPEAQEEVWIPIK